MQNENSFSCDLFVAVIERIITSEEIFLFLLLYCRVEDQNKSEREKEISKWETCYSQATQ